MVQNAEIAGEFKRLIELASTIEAQKSAAQPVTLDEDFKLKACCDVYLFSRARRELSKRKDK
jgi:hypothetical protein